MNASGDKKLPLAVAIMGPTASGKTAVALAIAARMPVEIISVDSALVYCGMDVGTAKPTPGERSLAPHHLIDILDPTESYSAMQFRRAALKLVEDIGGRGRLPLLVGGTMLYFKALRDGLDVLPEANPALRTTLEAQAAQSGIAFMHAKLRGLDPATAARLEPNDSQRVLRALEIIELTGVPMSQLLAQAPRPELPFRVLPIALEPSNRAVLHERIARRFDAMLAAPDDSEAGLIGEVRRLRHRGDLHPGLPSMRCVGYRQAWAYLDGEFDRGVLREKGIAATRQLAKRQLTWLRSMTDRVVIDCLDGNASERVLEAMAQEIPG
jgi:tRNA dimethylallyltransferase